MLRIVGGLFFILAGIFAYYGFAVGLFLPLLFVGAGAVVLLVAVAGHRASGGDIAIFVIGLIVLGSVSASLAVGGKQTVVYSATRSQVEVGKLLLNVSSGYGGVDIRFSSSEELAYQINFTRSLPALFPASVGPPTFSNRTEGGVLLLQATSQWDAITVTLGEGYMTNITASTGAGSVTIKTLGTEHLGNVSVSTGAGSIDASLTVASIGGLDLGTGAGSVTLTSAHLVPVSPHVPVSVSSGAGSVSINIGVPSSSGVSISASSGLGSVSHNLPGFVVTSSSEGLKASAGVISGSNPSLYISLLTGVGSMDVDVHLT